MTKKMIKISKKYEWDQLVLCLKGPTLGANYGYYQAAADLEKGSCPAAITLQIGDAYLFHPFLLRPIPDFSGYYDLINAYEFGGFWFNTYDQMLQEQLLSEFTRAMPKFAIKQGWICEFIRENPMIPMPETATGLLSMCYERTQHALHSIIDTSQGYDFVYNHYKRNFRKQLRQAKSNNLTAQKKLDLESFIPLYYQNLKRLNAVEYYYFPKDFLLQLYENLSAVVTFDEQGKMCANHLYLIDGSTAYAFLCHSVFDKNSLRPNNFTYDAFIQSACQDPNITQIHLGCGAASIAAFKKAMSTHTVPSYHCKAIFDLGKYQEIVAHNKTENSEFFPAYRA